MDPNTGKIYEVVDEELLKDMRRRGFEEIPRSDVAQVTGMNRKQRRAWAAARRSEKSKARDQ